MDKTGEARKLQLNELEVVRNDTCEDAVNISRDKIIRCKKFHFRQKVLLNNSRLHLFSSKLRSKWTGPFVVKKVFPYGAMELEDPKRGDTFKVNGKYLNPYLEERVDEIDTIWLSDPVYRVE